MKTLKIFITIFAALSCLPAIALNTRRSAAFIPSDTPVPAENLEAGANPQEEQDAGSPKIMALGTPISGSLPPTTTQLPPYVQADKITPEIQAQADSFGQTPNPSDPTIAKRIADWVQNNIKYECYSASRRGAHMTLLDRAGNDFDQASLLVALLRAAGYNAQYKIGPIQLRTSDVATWLGCDPNDPAGISNVLVEAGVTYHQCPTLVYHDYTTLLFARVYIPQTGQEFAPALKPQTVISTAAIDFDNPNIITHLPNYSPSGFLTKVCATPSTPSIQTSGVGVTNLTTALNACANDVENAAGKSATGTDIAGIPQLVVTLNPGQFHYDQAIVSSCPTTVSNSLSSSFAMSIQIVAFYAYSNSGTITNVPDSSWQFFPAELTGKIKLYYTSSGSYYEANLECEGATSIITPNFKPFITNIPKTTGGIRYVYVLPGSGLEGSAPWDISGLDGAYDSATYPLTYNTKSVIMLGFGDTSGRLANYLKSTPPNQRLDAWDNLYLLSLQYQANNAAFHEVLGGVTDSFVHQDIIAGLVHGDYSASFDITGGVLAVCPKSSNINPSTALDNISKLMYATTTWGSAMESTTLNEYYGAGMAVSTVTYLQQAANSNKTVWLASSTDDISNACSSNTGIYGLGATTDSAIFNDMVKKGEKILFPIDYVRYINNIKVSGYMHGTQLECGDAIEKYSGGLLSGILVNNSTPNLSPQVFSSNPKLGTFTPPSNNTVTTLEPIDMSNGSYTASHTDISIGDGSAPLGLAFTREYSSAASQYDPAGLGNGWTHNYNIQVVFRNAYELDTRTLTPAEAAPLIVAARAMYDTFAYNGTAREWLTPVLIAAWGAQQLINSRAAVVMGGKTLQFVRRPDVTYAPPPGIDAALVRNSDGSLSLKFYKGLEVDFDVTSRKFTKIWDPTLGANVAVKASYTSDGLLSTVTDAFNRSLRLSYTGTTLSLVKDDYGRAVTYSWNGPTMSTVTDATGATTTDYYDPATLKLTSSLDGNRNTVFTNFYNALGQVAAQRTFDDSARQWDIGAAGGLSRLTDPSGKTQWFHFDERGRLTAHEDELGNISGSVYDAQDRTVTAISPRGNETKFTYDDHNQITRIYDPMGHPPIIITPSNDNETSEYSMTDRENNTTIATFYPNHLAHLIEGPHGETTEYMQYDNYGRVSQLRPAAYAAGKYIQFAYSTDNKNITITYPDKTTEKLALNNWGDITSITDRLGHVTTKTYDNNRRVTQVSSDNSTVNFGYDEAGNLASVTDANGNPTTFTYNPNGDLLTATDPMGGQITNTYNVKNLLASTQNTAEGSLTGEIVTRAYDAAGRLSAVTTPLARAATLHYDEDGNITAASTPMGNITEYDYDANNNVISTIDPMEHQQPPIKFGYDNDGRRTSITNRNGNQYKTSYYLTSGTMTSQTPLGYQTITTWNNRGLVDTAKLPSGKNIKNTAYDDEGRLITQIVYDSGNNQMARSDYTYYANGLINQVTETMNGTTEKTTRTYDALDRLKTYSDGEGHTTTYDYDNNGNLVLLTYPDGFYVSYDYDKCNRLISVVDSNRAWTYYFYDTKGRLIQTKRPNRTTRTQSYDIAGRCCYIEERDASNALIWMASYEFDDDGNIIKSVVSPSANVAEPDDSFSHDADNRLTGGGFSFDSDGNMLTGIQPNGNMASYTYDAYGRVASENGVTQHYNPDGLRTGGEGTTYVVDPNAPLSRVLIRGKNNTHYVWGLGLIYEYSSGTSGNTITYHTDHLGSTAATTDGTSNVVDRWAYSSYGTEVHTQGNSDTPFRFHGSLGCITDDNGLVYMRARYYNPRIMRWLSSDPAGFSGGLNLFAAFGNNPISGVDPSGLCPSNELAGQTAPYIANSNSAAMDCYSAGMQDIIKDAYGTVLSRSAVTNSVSRAQGTGSIPSFVNDHGVLLQGVNGNDSWDSVQVRSGTVFVSKASGSYNYSNTAYGVFNDFNISGTVIRNALSPSATTSMDSLIYNMTITTTNRVLFMAYYTVNTITPTGGTVTGTRFHALTGKWEPDGYISVGNFTGVGGYVTFSDRVFGSGTLRVNGTTYFIIMPEVPTIAPSTTSGFFPSQ